MTVDMSAEYQQQLMDACTDLEGLRKALEYAGKVDACDDMPVETLQSLLAVWAVLYYLDNVGVDAGPLEHLPAMLESKSSRKPVDEAFRMAATAACVDILRTEDGDLRAALGKVARATHSGMSTKQLETFRKNLIGYRARQSAIDTYEHLKPAEGVLPSPEERRRALEYVRKLWPRRKV